MKICIFIAILAVLISSHEIAMQTFNAIQLNCTAPTRPGWDTTISGIISNAPLFSNLNMELICEENSDMFLPSVATAIKDPFTKLNCKPNQLLTGARVCFGEQLDCVASQCTYMKEGYEVIDKEERDNTEDRNQVQCPDNKVMVSMELLQDDGEITVKITCATIVKRDSK